MEERRGTSVRSRLGLVSASLVAALLLVGALKRTLIVLPALGLQNWLVVLFRVNAGRLGTDSLRLLNPIDLAVLLLVATTFLGLWPFLDGRRRAWMSIAVALPLMGIPLLLATHLAGRSAVMGSGLIVSLLMLSAPGFKVDGYLGVAANALLLVGDFATTGSPAPLVAVGLVIGYALLTTWYVRIAVALFEQARHT